MSPSTTTLAVLKRLKQEAITTSSPEKTIIRDYVLKLNDEFQKTWNQTSIAHRVLFLPQCLREPSCSAPLDQYGYRCQRCTPDCQINQILHMAEHLGYRHVYILPGGTMAQHLIETLQPIAVFGISCEKEALLGGLLLQEHGITGQIVLLLHDGCVSTKVDLSAVYAILKQKPL